MDTFLKSTEISKKLFVTTHTIRRWVYRYSQYFSEEARAINRRQSLYTPEDFQILATITYLSNSGFSLESIEQRLAEGFRYEGALDFDPPSPNELVSEDSLIHNDTELLQLRFERDFMRDSLIQAQQQIKDLMSELLQTQYKLGVAEGKVETLERQLSQNQQS